MSNNNVYIFPFQNTDYTDSMRHSLWIDLIRREYLVFNFTDRTRSSLPVNTFLRCMFASWTSLTSPTEEFLICLVHFCRNWFVGRYSFNHLFLEQLVVNWTCFHLCQYVSARVTFTNANCTSKQSNNRWFGVSVSMKPRL